MFQNDLFGTWGPPAKKGKWAAGAMGLPTGDAAGQSEAEVRFENADSVQAAVTMSGTMLGGSPITVTPDLNSKDGTKVIVSGFGTGVGWQEVKDLFRACGVVAHADVKGQGTGTRRGGCGFPCTGTVRMSTVEEAQIAVQTLNGSEMLGSAIEVRLHTGSKDGTKLIVTGIPPGVAWQQLKDLFANCGKVEHADTTPIVPGRQIFGEVRFPDPSQAQVALKTLNGSQLGSSQIFLSPDMTSSDGTKIVVSGLGPEIQWQELKDHFSSIGAVAYACVHKDIAGGKGRGGGKGPFGGGKGAVFGGCQESFGGFKGGAAGYVGGALAGVCGGCASGMETGTVRFHDAYAAQLAVAHLNGAVLNGAHLNVDMDWKSQDGTKLWIGGIAPGTGWQELKDMFSQCGNVAFANVGKGKGKGTK